MVVSFSFCVVMRDANDGRVAKRPRIDAMERRRLPGTEIDVSVLCLGTWAFAGTAEKPDATHGFIDGGQPAIEEIVATALECGINFFDTAEAYAGHAAERSLGAALSASGRPRGDYVVASKFGRHAGNVDERYGGAEIRAALGRSLDALGLDFIDLYQVSEVEWETRREQRRHRPRTRRQQKFLRARRGGVQANGDVPHD